MQMWKKEVCLYHSFIPFLFKLVNRPPLYFTSTVFDWMRWLFENLFTKWFKDIYIEFTPYLFKFKVFEAVATHVINHTVGNTVQIGSIEMAAIHRCFTPHYIWWVSVPLIVARITYCRHTPVIPPRIYDNTV